MEQFKRITKHILAYLHAGSCLDPARSFPRRPHRKRSPPAPERADDGEATEPLLATPAGGPARPQPRVVICLLGAPGTGKGTYAGFLARRFGLRHLAYGDLLRELRDDARSAVSGLALRPGTRNPMVPGDLGARCVAARLERDDGGGGGSDAGPWLVDGFPRRATHVAAWWAHVGCPALVLHLACPVEESLARVAGRAGRTGRPEDRDPDVARERVERWHCEEQELLLELRRRMPGRVVTIRTDRDMDIVQANLAEVVAEVLPSQRGSNGLV